MNFFYNLRRRIPRKKNDRSTLVTAMPVVLACIARNRTDVVVPSAVYRADFM
jgi:hypothetical protein